MRETAMKEDPDRSVIDYVFGTASPAVAREIEARAAADADLAAKINLLRALAGVERPGGSEAAAQSRKAPARGAGRRWATRPALAAALAGVLLVGGTVGAAHYLFRTPPLLEDTFGDGWLDGSRWTGLRPVVVEEDGHIRLQNRGYLVTRKGFPSAKTIEFDWRPVDLAHYPHYAEILTVALHTTGKPRPKHSYEVQDGLVIKLDAQDGLIVVYREDDAAGFGQTERGAVALPAGKWHRVRIVDTLESVAIFVSGPAISKESPDKPLLDVPYAGSFRGEKIAIYNRELVAEVPHESHIDNFLITELTPIELP